MNDRAIFDSLKLLFQVTSPFVELFLRTTFLLVTQTKTKRQGAKPEKEPKKKHRGKEKEIPNAAPSLWAFFSPK